MAENLLFRIENLNLDEKQDEVKLDFLGKANIRWAAGVCVRSLKGLCLEKNIFWRLIIKK